MLPSGLRPATTLLVCGALVVTTRPAQPRAAGQTPSIDRPQVSADPLPDLLSEAGRLLSNRQWTEALPVLERARALAGARGDAAAEADLLRRLGFVERQLRNLPAAARDLERAIVLLDGLGDRASAGQARSERANLAFAQSDWPGVRRYYGEAAEAFAAAGDHALEANALRNATFARDMSNEDREVLLARAWEALAGVDDAFLKGLVLHQWGDVINLRGDYARATEKLEAAEPLLAAAGRANEYAALLTSLGRTLRLHGRADRALEVYARVLEVQQKNGDTRGLAQTYDAMAVADDALGRVHDAIAAGERAVALAREAGNDAAANSYLANLADNRLKAGDLAAAARDLEEVLAAGSDPHAEGPRRDMLSRAYEGLGRLDDARREADRAVALTEAAGEPEYLVPSLDHRAQLRRALRDVAGALADARRALDLIETLRANAVPSDAMKQTFVDRHRALFTLTLDLLSETGDAAGGLEVAERARARAFLDLLATRAAGGDSAASGGLGTALAGGPALASPVAVPPPPAAAIEAVAARLGSTLVSYWVAPDATFIWVVAPDGTVRRRRLSVPGSRYDELARALGSGTREVSLDRDPRPALRELYDRLIAPVEAWLPAAPGSLLTIVPHGPLFRLSFAALLDARGRYLLERYRLHYAPSAALLGFTAAAATARPGPRTFLLVADPQPLAPGPDGQLAPLPGARDEVRAVQRLVPADRTSALVGRDATKARVRAAVAGRAVLHLATHGLVYDDRPFESYLALGRDAATGDDGRLTTADIYELRLNAELVVLSACRSATGTITGDGMAGLTRAFFYAGTPSVLATLWDLADAPAERLLPAFYREWLAGRDKAAALRDAQLSLLAALRQGGVKVGTPLGEVALPEHPALWAGLILMGEP